MQKTGGTHSQARTREKSKTMHSLGSIILFFHYYSEHAITILYRSLYSDIRCFSFLVGLMCEVSRLRQQPRC